MVRPLDRRLLLGISVVALLASAGSATAQTLVNPSGSIVGLGFISVDPGETFDDVFNFGIITGDDGVGIGVVGPGVVRDDVRNEAGGLIAIGGETGFGMAVNQAGFHVGGDVENEGFILLDVEDRGTGILVSKSDGFLGGDVANRRGGVIRVAATGSTAASARGIAVQGDVEGIERIVNAGLMQVGALATAHQFADAASTASFLIGATGRATAIGIDDGATGVVGAVVNAGALDVAAADRLFVRMRAAGGFQPHAVFGGSTIALSAVAVGIDARAGEITDGVVNLGVIDVAASAALTALASASDASSSVQAAYRSVAAVSRTVDASALGLQVTGLQTVGAVRNSGAIDATAAASLRLGLLANGLAGAGLVRLTAPDGVGLDASAAADGLLVQAVTAVEDGLLSTGDIGVVAAAAIDLDAAADAGAHAEARLGSTSSAVRLAANVDARGIVVAGVATVGGDIRNMGGIDVGGDASVAAALTAHAASGSASAVVSWFNAPHTVSGGLVLTGSAAGTGIGVFGGFVDGDVRNTGAVDVAIDGTVDLALDAEAATGIARAILEGAGTMRAGAGAFATGIEVAADAITGDVANSGDVSAVAASKVGLDLDALAHDGPANAYVHAHTGDLTIAARAFAHGIDIVVGTVPGAVGGDVTNAGAIVAAATALADIALDAEGDIAVARLSAFEDGLAISLDFTVAATARAEATGLRVAPPPMMAGSVGGSVANSGAIQARAEGETLIHIAALASGLAVAGIDARDVRLGAHAEARGLVAAIDDIGGSILNAGTVGATALAGLTLTLFASGSIAVAEAKSQDRTLALLGTASALGADLVALDVAGDVANSGDVLAIAHGAVDATIAAEGSVLGDAGLFASGGDLVGSAKAAATVVLFSIVDGGGVANSGDVTAIADADQTLAVAARAGGLATAHLLGAEDVRFAAAATANGILAPLVMLEGGVVNTGDIVAAADASLDLALNADGGEAVARIARTVTFSSAHDLTFAADASAMGLFASAVGADVENSGAIDVVGTAAVEIALTALAASGDARAVISSGGTVPAPGSILFHADARAVGLGAALGPFSDSVVNSGDLAVAVGAEVAVVLSADADHGTGVASISAPLLAGTIAFSATASATGLMVTATSLGTLSNSGGVQITAAAAIDLDIGARGAAASALLTAGGEGSLAMLAHAGADGLFVDAPGAITNRGALDVAIAAAVDIAMAASATTGSAKVDLFASDGLGIAATGYAQGLHVASAAPDGVTNGGAMTIAAGAAVAIGLDAAGVGDTTAALHAAQSLTIGEHADAYGLLVEAGSAPALAIANSGDLAVAATGTAGIALSAWASGVGGDAQASVSGAGSVTLYAAANAVGVLAAGDALGSVENSGAIDVTGRASLDVAATATAHGSTAGALARLLSADATLALSAIGTAVGLLVAADTADAVTNSGAIDALAVADLDVALSAYAAHGDAAASILAADGIRIGATAVAHGIQLRELSPAPNTIVALSNSGDIAARAVAGLDIRMTAAASGSADAVIAANSHIDIFASALAHGIDGFFGTLASGFDNAGDITVASTATLDLAFDATHAAISAPDRHIAAIASAFGVQLRGASGNTIGGDVTNDGDVVAVAHAFASVDGPGTFPYFATAHAAAFLIGESGTLDGDVRNSAVLGAYADAAIGAGGSKAHASAVGLDIREHVAGDVVNSGTIVGVATASSAYAYGIRLVGHAIDGTISNTGIVAAFAHGDTVEEAFALQLAEATGPTTIEQRDGFILGGINLDNTDDQTDAIEFSGGFIRGDIFGDVFGSNDTLVAFAGVDDTLGITGDISGLRFINVNPLGASASSVRDVELRLDGLVTNTLSLNVNSRGTLVAGLGSDIAVASYNQVPTGTTLFEIAPHGQSATIRPNSASLAGSVGIRPTSGLYEDHESYLVVRSTLPTFGTYETVRSTPLLEVDDRYNGYDVYLEVSRIAFDAVGGLNHNQSAVAGALEADYAAITPGTDLADVVGSLFGLTTDEYQAALDDLAGAEHAQMLKIGAGAIQSIDNALMGRLAFVRGLNAQQMASVDGVGMAFAQVASTGAVDFQMDLAQAEAEAIAAPGASGVWARVFGGMSALDGDQEAPGFDTKGGGVSVGIDHRISPDAVVGLYGGYAHTDADFDTDADGSVDTYQVGVYGSWANGPLHVDGLVTGAWQNYEVSRSIDFLSRTAKSDYDGWAFGAQAEVGYDVALGSAAVLEPMAGLDYIHLETDGFTESGADSVDLNVDSGEYDSLKSTLGVRLTAQVDMGDGMVLVPTASIAWEHEFLDAKGEFTASFDGSPGASFDIIGSDDEADAAVLSLGLALTSDNMTAFVGYDGKTSGDAASHQGTVGLRLGF